MSLKNSITTSDYLDFNSTSAKAMKIIKNEKNYKLGFLIVFGINTGWIISDILNLKHEDIGIYWITRIDSKTNYKLFINLEDNIKRAYELLLKRNIQASGYVFTSNQNTVYSIQYVNRELKKILGTKNLNISSHTLRKTYGRNWYFNNYESENALLFLSKLFNHSSLAITKKYLGISQEKLDDI